MPSIDLKTLFFDFTLTNSISLIFIYLLWSNNKNRYKGLHLIVTCYALNLVSIILIFLRGTVSDFSSIVLSNALSIFGIFCGLLGLEIFLGVTKKYRLNYLYFIVFLFIQSYFTWVVPNIAARNANIAFGLMFFCSQSAWLLLVRTPKHLRKLTRETGLLYIFFFCTNLIRFINQLSVALDKSMNHAQLTNFDLYILLLYQISLLILSFTIIHMINKRLKNDILQEEKKLRVVFHAVPYAILITRKTDGRILDINGGFEDITGFERSTVLGKRTEDIQLWVDNSEREKLLSILQKNNSVHDAEFLFYIKSGEIKAGQLSCINIMYEDTECLLSVVYDVTEKRRSEKELKLSRDILKDLILNLQTEHANEKINLATQLDNSLNQSLAALHINLDILKKRLKTSNQKVSDEVINLVETTQKQTGIAIERSLDLMKTMRNEVLYLFGFVEAITFSLEELQKQNNITCGVSTNVEKVELEKNRSFGLFNIVQDLLNTILHKNKATEIDVRMNVENDMLTLLISENGKSFDDYLVRKDGNTLLATLKEKVALLDGKIAICNNDTMATITIEVHV